MSLFFLNRIKCINNFRQIAENQDAPAETADATSQQESVINPLQYRPPQNRQRDALINRVL